MKKKAAAVLMAAVMILAAGCGSQNSSSSDSTGASESVSASADSTVSDSADEESQAASLPVTDKDVSLEDCIKLGNYKGLELTKNNYVISDDAAKEYAKSMTELTEVDDENATAQEGDVVNIKYVGTMDGKEFDGGSADDYDLELGSDSFIDGFEDGIIGMKKGETKELNLKFPDDYFSTDLAGKDVTFEVTVNKIQRYAEPTEDEISSAKEELASNYQTSADNELLSDAWKAVRNNSEFIQLRKKDVDEAEQELDDQIDAQLSSSSMTMDEFLDAQGITEESLNEQKEEQAKERAAETLLIEALAKAEDVDENSDDYKEHLQELADSYGLSTDDLISQAGEDSVYEYVMTETLANRIVKYANVTEKDVDPNEESDAAGSAE